LDDLQNMPVYGFSAISRLSRRLNSSELPAPRLNTAIESDPLDGESENASCASPTAHEDEVTEGMLLSARERVGTDPMRTNGLLYANITPLQRNLCTMCAAIDWRAVFIRNIKSFSETDSNTIDSPLHTRIYGRRWEEFELGKLKNLKPRDCALCDIITRGLDELISTETPEHKRDEVDEEVTLLCRCENPTTRPAPWPAKTLEYPETFGKFRLKIRFEGLDFTEKQDQTSFPDLEFSVVNDVSNIVGDNYSELMIKKMARPSINEMQIDMETLRVWTQQCRVEHPQCRSGWQGIRRKSAPKRSYLLRLLDCTSMKVVVTNSHRRYAALSYVWGRAKQYSSKKQDVICPDGEVDSEYVSLENRTLPRTVADAIQVCKEIGVRLLWVDTLCIIQDDVAEKKRTLAAMDQIYKSAVLTIVAASGTHADAGLAGLRPASRNTQACEGWLDGLRLRRVNKYDAEAVIEDTPWSKRGWTYQESYFSPRKLIFANDRAYYHCEESSFGEINPTQQGCFRKPIFHTHSSSGKDLQTLRNTPSGPFNEYAMHAENYNWRALSFHKDVLNAFAGVASDLEMATDKRMRLFQALPVGFFARALCWETKDATPTKHSTRRCGGPDMQPLLPTWSWAAWNRAVHYTHQYYFNEDQETQTFKYSFSFPWSPGAEYQLAEGHSDAQTEDIDYYIADVLRTGVLTFRAHIGELNKNSPIPDPHTMDDGTVWEYGVKRILSVVQVFGKKAKFGQREELPNQHFVLFLGKGIHDQVYYREGCAWMSDEDWERLDAVEKTVRLG
jgi:hypothetical protein